MSDDAEKMSYLEQAAKIDEHISALSELISDESLDVQISISSTMLGRMLVLVPEHAVDLLTNIGMAVDTTVHAEVLPIGAKLIICAKIDDREIH